jgi:hypothetical protein
MGDYHMNKILNLTQHAATPDQVSAGVVEPVEKAAVQALLTFEELPTVADIERRAVALARIAAFDGPEAVMMGGAPYFMAPLERALLAEGIRVLYAFSRRESVEEPDGSGGVKKTQVFRHAGFIEVG